MLEGRALVITAGGSISRASSLGDDFFLYTADIFEAREDLRLISGGPARVDDGLSVLESRILVLLYGDGSGGHRGNPSGICTDKFPPKGYGPATPLEGAAIEKGDIFALLVYATGRPDLPGDHAATGARVEYTTDSGQFFQTSEGSDLILSVRRTPAEFPSKYPPCFAQPSPWFGT